MDRSRASTSLVSEPTEMRCTPVSAIARTFGGGGHRQASGFSSSREIGEIVEQLHRAFLDVTRDEHPGDAAAGA